MSNKVKFGAICIIVSILLWTMGSAILCLGSYEVPQSKDIVIAKVWAGAFAKAQQKACLIGSCIGIAFGAITYFVFSRRPSSFDKVIKPENSGKMFGSAPVTKADFCLPYCLLPLGQHSIQIFYANVDGTILFESINDATLRVYLKAGHTYIIRANASAFTWDPECVDLGTHDEAKSKFPNDKSYQRPVFLQ